MERSNELWGNICFDTNSEVFTSKNKKRIAGIHTGIIGGPHKVDVKDIMFMVPCRKNDDVSAMIFAWGKEFNDAGSLELFTFSGEGSSHNSSIEEPIVLAKYAFDGLDALNVFDAKLPMLVYSGKEGGIKESLSLKVKKHMTYVAHDVATKGDTGRYAGKKWFIKSDTDTFIVTQHLLTVLSNYDPDEPWYIGYRFEKGGYRSVSGGMYALSRKAMEMLDSRLAGASILRYEDMMIGNELKRVGVIPTEIKGFHWKRPFQREIEWGIVGGLVQVHKIKGKETMNDLLSWTKYVLED